MVNEVKVEYTPAKDVAVVRKAIKVTEQWTKREEILTEILNFLDDFDNSPIGPPFARFHERTPDEVDIEAGVPVAKLVMGNGYIEGKHFEPCRMAGTWHVGPYEKIHDTYEKLEKWILSNHLKRADIPWEVYWTDPSKEGGKTRVQVFWPVK